MAMHTNNAILNA